MFITLTHALTASGFSAADLFDIHPAQLLTLAEAGWERERRRRDLPWPGLTDPSGPLRGFGAVTTGSGKTLGEAEILSIAAAALTDYAGPPTLARAWLIEGSGLVELMSELVQGELSGVGRLKSASALRWLRASEDIFAGNNLLTLRGPMRPTPSVTRRQTYRRSFGGPVGANGVVFDGMDGSFTSLMSGALAEGKEAVHARGALGAYAEPPVALAREAFAAVELVSWFYLSLALPDSPICRDLGLEGDLLARLEGLANHLGKTVSSKAGPMLQAADAMDSLLRGLSRGETPSQLAAMAELWPVLEGPPEEDPETGAGGDVGAAFKDGMNFNQEGPEFFGEGITPDALRVTDPDARIRTGPTAFALTTQRFAQNTDVVTDSVYLASGTYYIQARGPNSVSGWTKLGNVRVNPNAVVGVLPPGDSSQTGPWAAWDNGRYIGQITLIVVGATTSSGLALVAEKTLTAYIKMQEAAAAAGHTLTINSGFRSYPEQKALYDAYKAGKGNLAAAPGKSNHQSGEAIDMPMAMGKGNPSSTNISTWSAVYRWMVKNARTYGFMRTVESEAWHWEYRPTEATNHDTFGNWTALKKAGG